MEKVQITGANRGLGRELLKPYDEKASMTFPVVRTEQSAIQIRQEFPINCFPN